MAKATISADPPAPDQWDRLVRAVETGVGTIHLPVSCRDARHLDSAVG